MKKAPKKNLRFHEASTYFMQMIIFKTLFFSNLANSHKTPSSLKKKGQGCLVGGALSSGSEGQGSKLASQNTSMYANGSWCM